MTYELDRVKEELIQAIDKLSESAMDDAKDQLLNDSQGLADYLFKEATCGWTIEVGGIEWVAREGDEPLTVYLYDHEGDGLLYSHDPIQALIDNITPRVSGELASAEQIPEASGEASSILRAIDTLNHAIDRLKDHAKFRGIELDGPPQAP